MNVQETVSEGLKRTFSVTIPAEKITQEVMMILNRIGKTAKIAGFRPGKIPAPVLSQRYGQSALQEALDNVINTSTQSILTDKNIRPALKPSLSITSYEDKGDLVYDLSLEMLPTIMLDKFDDIKLERIVAEVGDDTLSDRLKEMAAMMKQPESITEERGAKKGDVVMIDFDGFVDGKAIAGGAGKNVNLTLGSNQFIPGFEEQLEGVKKGETYELTVTFPETYHEKSLAGKPATFKGIVHDICALKESGLDDAFAKLYGFESLEELKTNVRKHLQDDYDDTSFLKAKRDVLDVLAQRYTFDVPQSMVDLEFNMIWKQLLQELGISDAANQNATNTASKKTIEEALGKSEDASRVEYRTIAERRVRLGLVLAEIGQINKIGISNEELSQALMRKAREYPGHEREVINYYRSNEQAMATLRAPVFENKAIEWIMEQTKVTTKIVPIDALRAMIEDEEEITVATKEKKAPAKKPKASKEA